MFNETEVKKVCPTQKKKSKGKKDKLTRAYLKKPLFMN